MIRRGRPERELVELAPGRGRRDPLSTDVSPFARARRRRTGRRLREAGVDSVGHPGLNAIDDVAELRTKAGKPYTVFSPFHRAWLAAERRPVLEAPRELPPLPDVAKGRILPQALGLEQEVDEPPPGGSPRVGDSRPGSCEARCATTTKITTRLTAIGPRGSPRTCTSGA